MKRDKRSLLHKTIKELQGSIKNHCYECNGGTKKIDCEITDCPLYPFRPFGRTSDSNLRKKKEIFKHK